MMICAIDPSLTGTGIVVGDGTVQRSLRITSKPQGKEASHRLDRYDGIIESIEAFIGDDSIELCLIEGYSYGSNGANQMYLGEFGGLLRQAMRRRSKRVVEIAPTMLKKFATGKGNARKEVVLAHVMQRWGEMFEQSDVADAYVLYRIGLCVAGVTEPDNKSQAEVITKVVKKGGVK